MIKIYLVLIFIQVLFGANFPASKIIVSRIDPLLWSNVRFLIAGIIMAFFSILMRRKHPPLTKEFILPLLPLSILGMGLGQGLFLIGLNYTTPVNSAVLITFIPILTLLIVILRKQEELTFNKLFGFVMAFMGVILLRDITNFTLSNRTFLGDSLVFLSALCFALYLCFGKEFLMKFDNMWTTSWMFIISGLLMSIFNIDKFIEITELDMSYDLFYCCLYSVFGATILTYFLNNWSLKRVSSGNVAIFIYLQPIVAGLIAYFYLDQEISFRVFFCSLLILSGLIFTIWDDSSKKAFKRESNG